MKAVFDTNILIDYLNGIKNASQELSRYKIKLISVITYIEVLVGAEDKTEESVIRGFLSTFQVCGITEDVAEASVKIRKEHKLKIPDAIVYATAQVEGCMMVSRNTIDFKKDWLDVRVPYEI